MFFLRGITKNITVRNGIIFAFFSFLNSGIGFLLLIILASYISPDGYGKLSLFNTLVTLLGIFICLSTTGYVSVAFFQEERKKITLSINAILAITLCVFSLLCFTLLFFPKSLEILIGINIEYQWFALLICFFQIFTAINLDILRIEEKPFKYGLYSTAIVLLNFCLTIALIVHFKSDWLGRVYSQVVITMTFGIMSFMILFKREIISFKLPSKELLKQILLFGIPLLPHLLSFWLRQGLDRYVINYYHSAESVGYYSFATNIANIINIFGAAFNATNSVFIYKILAQGYTERSEAKLKRQTKLMFFFFLIMATILIALASLFIPVFFASYSGSIIYLLPLCIVSFFQSVYLLFVNFLFYYRHTKQLMYITFSFSFVQMVLSILLTKYSMIYTAYISVFISLLIALGVVLYSRKIVKRYWV